MKFWGLPAMLLVALTTWACTDAVQTLGPEAAQMNQGVGVIRYNTVASTVPDGTVRVDSAWLGAAGGGLSAANYHVLVPGGAVRALTKFKMEVHADGRVDLTATRTDSKGNEIDVGATGFRKPVTLAMYYGWSAQQISDPSKLFIVWVVDRNTHVPVPSTVDQQAKLVHGTLSHFSQYALVMP